MITSVNKRRYKREYYEANKSRLYKAHRNYVANHSEARKAYLKRYWQDPKNRQRRRELYRLRIDHFKKRDRDHYYRTRDRHRELHMAKWYKITVEQYRELMAKGVCDICGKPQNAKGKVLSIDHCHATGKVRGVLCNNCNNALGHIHEDIELLDKIRAYLTHALSA